jgi:ParB-like chromosome segregation protein Spo0J
MTNAAQKSGGLELVYRKIDELKPDPRNTRLHPPEQLASMVKSMREFGFTVPVIIDDGSNVVAGHARLMTARHLGMKEVPTIRLGGLTEAQLRAYSIADNRTAELAKWDDRMLAAELAELKVDMPDLTVTGFSSDELSRLLAPPSFEDPRTRRGTTKIHTTTKCPKCGHEF